MAEQNRKYCTVEEAADVLGIAQETVRRLLREGTIKGSKTITRQWRVDWLELLELAKNYKPEGGSDG